MDERCSDHGSDQPAHEISALLDAGRAVNSTLELDRVLDSILAGATDLLPASSGSVMLLDGEELVVAAIVGNQAALGRRAAIGDGIAGHVARTREPLLIDGRATSSVFPGLVRRSGDEVRSALCVPLIERGELLGVLNLSAPVRGRLQRVRPARRQPVRRAGRDRDRQGPPVRAQPAAGRAARARRQLRRPHRAGQPAPR
jgi:GAF domain-containing protein